MGKQQIIRNMQYAGSWYESDPDSLKNTIDTALDDARIRSGGLGSEGLDESVDEELENRIGVCLAMLPHAGLVFSARGIASLFANLPVLVSRILILAPSHYAHIPADTLTTASFDLARTPLGDVSVMPLHDLLPGRVVHIDRKSVGLEHAVEMFLPFCADYQQTVKREISVGMGLISRITSETSLEMLSGAVLEAVGDESILNGETVIIASSDFTHYGSRFGYIPFSHLGSQKAVQQAVMDQDLSFARLFAAGNTAELLVRQRNEQPSICGFAPGLIVSTIGAQLGLTGEVFDQYTSNDVTGYSSDFVDYCSILWR
jgi:MEMO1 family protein